MVREASGNVFFSDFAFFAGQWSQAASQGSNRSRLPFKSGVCLKTPLKSVIVPPRAAFFTTQESNHET